MAKFNTGQSFADGDTVTGAKLNNITSQLNIYTGVISEQTAMSATVSTADQLLIADTDNGDSGSANRITVQKLFSDSLTNGTFASVNLTGTITSNRTVATSATITTGTIPTLVSNNATIGTTTGTAGVFTSGTITTGLIPTLTAGTTTGTAGIFTSGTIATLNSTTGTIGSFNSTTGTIGNFTTTLTGDVTISAGVATASTATVAKLASAQEYTAAHNFNATTLTSGNSIAWDLSANQVARLVLSTNGTMSDASNKVDGSVYILLVTQGTGSNTLAWNATYKWPGGTAPTLTTGSAKSDIFTFISNGTSLFGVASQNYS